MAEYLVSDKDSLPGYCVDPEIARAVLAERERCAKIAESHIGSSAILAGAMAGVIAKEIRKGE